MRTEKEEELLALENYWKERLAAQEAETVHRQKLTEQEVSSPDSAIWSWWHFQVVFLTNYIQRHPK